MRRRQQPRPRTDGRLHRLLRRPSGRHDRKGGDHVHRRGRRRPAADLHDRTHNVGAAMSAPTCPRAIAVIWLAAIVWPAPARAQSQAWTDRGFVNVGGWYQASSLSFDDVEQPIVFAEPALVTTRYTIHSAAGLDASGGMRVWRNLAVGAGVSYFS